MSQLFTDDELFGKPSSGGKLFTDEELFGNGSTSKNQNKGAAADIGTDLKRGTLKIPSMVTGLLDIPVAAVTGRPMVSEGWDEIGKLTGFQPGKWAKDAEGDYSQGRKQARQNIDAAWEDGSVLDIAQAYKDNPSQTLGSIAESIPSMLTGSVLGRALMGVGAKAVSTGAGAVGPALPGALARAAGEKWAPSIAAGAGEGSVMAGQAMSDLVEKGVDPRTAAGYAATIGVAGGALGTLGGKVAQRMGVIDPETALTGGVTRAANGIESATAMQAAKEAGKRIVGGGIVEGVFEELPQSLIEQGLSNLAQDKPFTEGLARAGVEGTLAGTAMGGAFNLRPAKKGETEAVPPVSPPAVAPTAPEQPAPAVTANEVAQHAATRLAEIERKATGSEERTIRGPDGAPVVIPGEQPQFLTHEEKAEREFLLNNQADPAALAAGYGVQIKESERDPFERLAEISLISEQRELTPAEAGEYTQLVTQIESGEAYAETEAQPADVSQNVQKINTSGEPVQNTPENEQVTQHTITAPDIKTAVQSAAQQYGPDVVIVGQKNTAAGVSLTVSVPAQAADNPAAPVSNTAIGELQNRDRSRAASVNQMQSIARSPDYMRLGPSRTPDSGAPMVFAVGNDLSAIQPTHMGREDVAVMADGQRVPFRYAVVDANAVNPSNFADGTANPGFSSGEPGALKALNNGRAAGMRAAHGAGNGLAYTAELIADATSHGVPVEAIRSTPNPMLVRVYSEDSNTSDMAAKSQGQGLGMSPAELAQQDAPLIDLSALAVYEPGDIASAGNRDFVRSFVGGLQASGQDIAPLITADGQLSQMGRQRIQAALVQAAYGDADLVQEMFDSTDTDIKAIGEVLKSVAGAWAGMRKAAEIGAINPETDITGNLMQAVRMIQSSRRNKTSIYDMINQRDIMTGETPDALTVSTLRLFYTGQYLTRAAGKERLADSLSRYLTGAIQTQESGGLFGDTVSAQDVLNSITQGDQSESGNQAEESGRESGGRSATRGGADRPGAQAPRPGTNEAGRGIDEAGREAPAQAEPEASAQEGGEGVGAEALTLTGQTSAEVLQQERDRVAAESEATRLAAQESAEKKAAEKKSLEDAIKARAANPDNFQFGEDAKAAAKPMGGLFDQPSANDQPANSKPSEMDALKAEMGQAIGELASILGAKQNLTPEEESRIIPVMSKIFRIAAKMGYIKFKDAANYVLGQIRTMAGKEIADKISIENLQAGYINVSKEIGGDKREAMSYDSIEDLEKANVIDERSSADLERDRRDTETQDSVGEDGLRAGRDGDGRTGRPGMEGAEGNNGERGGIGSREDEAAATGERGDQQIYTGAPELTPGAAGNNVDLGSSDGGIDGLPIEPSAAGQIENLARSDYQKEHDRLAQKRADKLPQAYGLEAIKAALPILSEGQQEDVLITEARFAVPDGYGMLFTNGTGTGKTFSGLGVIKRFTTQGKQNILIVAPNDEIITAWIKAGRMLGLDLSRLADTNDAGKGVVITTYANMGANNSLASRDWDLVVHDEAHYLAMDKDGTNTNALKNLRAISLHPDGVYQRHSMIHAADIEKRKKLDADAKSMRMSDDQRNWVAADKVQAEAEKIAKKLTEQLDAIKKDVAGRQLEKRTRVMFLSATPFAYEKTVDWANGYIFDYNEGRASEEGDFRGYNVGSNRDQFMMQHFGYRMRYGKLTQPDAKVDSGLMQRQFNSWLKKKGSVAGRMLDVAADYDRRFILVDSAIGQRIDEALQWFGVARKGTTDSTRKAALHDVEQFIYEKFNYLSRRYLLESIKAREVVPHIREHLAMGRKVVVFHDYKKGGGFNPFQLQERIPGQDATTSGDTAMINQIIGEFRAEFKDLINSDLFRQSSPIEMFQQEFPDVLLFNGDVPQKTRRANVQKFQDDASGPQVILVQSAAGKEGISLHDTTGKHQRVLFNLGQPTQPTTAIQQEGRIYRTGQVSDAIFRYLNTGTNWEKWAFATTIATRASAAENLGMGELARSLKDAFITGFEESGDYRAGMENEGKGGKERDKAANSALTEYDRARAFYFGTQKKTSKTKAQEGADYFATPEPVGFKMVEWADIRPGEKGLEPSAGHGAIARWMPTTAERTAIEPSMALRPRLAMVFDGQIIDSDFESMNVVNKFDAIVMNPPFGSGGKTAVDHLAKAATHLRDGGRIVALLPTGPAADKKFEKWMYETNERPAKPLGHVAINGVDTPIYKGDTVESRASWAPTGTVTGWWDGSPTVTAGGAFAGAGASLVSKESIKSVQPTGKRTVSHSPAEGLYMIADIKMPAVTFERAGTQVMTRIVVIEKSVDPKAIDTRGVYNRDFTNAEDINDLFDRLEDMALPNRAKAVEQEPEEAPKPGRKAKPAVDTVAAQAAAEKAGLEIIEHTTGKGKVIRGVVRTDLSREEAKAIDEFTFKKDGGWFIREKHLVGDGTKLSRGQSTAEPITEQRATAAITNILGKAGKLLIDAGQIVLVRTEEGLKNLPGAVAWSQKQSNTNGMADKDTVAGTQAPTSAGDGSTGSATIEVDGVLRSTLNSNGKPIHPTEEGVRNFWKWFGDSHVVDANGRPLVVYHGTTADVSAFSKEKLGSSTKATSAKQGFFFTTSPKVATSYAIAYDAAEGSEKERAKIYASRKAKARLDAAERELESYGWGEYIIANADERKEIDKDLVDRPNARAAAKEFILAEAQSLIAEMEEGGNILPVYLRINSPLEHDHDGNHYRDQTYAKTLQLASSNGHDGAVIKNTFDAISPRYSEKMDVFVVFEPSQIKSAIGNAGSFGNNANQNEPSASAGSDVRYSRQNDLQSNNGLPNESPINRTIDANELTALRRAAARLERPEDGVFLRVTEDGIAIATGPKGTRIPDAFVRFAKDHDLAFEARRNGEGRKSNYVTVGKHITSKTEPTPTEYREAGALYFGEGNVHFDRTGKTRFAKDAGAIQGATLPDGRIVLVLENLTQDNIGGVLKHEGFHATTRALVGEETYQKIMGQLGAMRKAGNGAAWFKQALAAVPEGTAASDINEEIGAYAVEQYENGEQQPPVIRKWVGSLLSAIRTAIIRRMPAGKLKNWAIANITGQDMARLAVAGLRAKANRIEQAQGLGVNALNESDIVNLYGSRYSRASVKAKVDELTSQDAINTLIYNFQNKFIDLKNIKDRIIKMGGQVTDLNDAYLGEETYHSKVMKRGKDFLEGEMKQLLQQLHNNQIKKEDFEQFLHARHAPERNAEMAKRNPNQAMIDAGRTQADADVKALELQLQKATAQGLATKAIDAALTKARAEKTKWHGAQAFQGTEDERNSLSGMSDAAAAQVMASTPAGRRSTMDSAAAKVDAINAKTLDIQLASGLIDKATFDAIKKTYQFYVPLHRDEAHPDQNSHSIGQGFSVKGAGIQRATGSNEKVTNILGHIALQREAQNTRAEKNSVVKRLVLMAMQNPLKDFWAIDKPPMIKTIDQRTGFVRSSVDPMYKNKPNVVMARIAGKDIAIVFNERNPEAVRLAEALKNLDGQDLDVVERSIGRVTRWIASVNTQYNPIFGLINFARDVQGAMFNLTTTELKDHKAATWKETFRLFKEITKSGFQLDKMNAADQALWNDFQNSGGATGYRDMFANPEERTKALEKELKALDGGPVAQKFRATVQWLSDYNESMENVVRLAAYKVAVQNGMSKERAASLAKNLTVNFNRKGAKAQKLGAFYAFFNASIQGSTRLAKTLKGPAGRKIIAGGIALGVMQQMLGMMMMGGGDDDEWEKIPGFIKERSIVIPTSKDAYVAIPMPLGFNVIPNVGRLFAEWAMGGSDKPTGKQLAKLVGVIVSGFNPVGGTDLVDAVTPTAADPMIALLRNKDWTGKPIYREDMASLDPTPGFTRTKDSATPWAKGIAYAVNWASGGTDYQPGAVSWTPDQVDYIFGTVFGGAGRELGKLAQTLAAPFSAEELPMHKVPLFGRVVGSTAGVSGQSAKFYENIRTLNGFEQEIQGRNEKGEDVDQFLKSEPRAELVGLANAAERQVKQLRKTQKLLKDEGDNAGAKELDASITEVMKGLNVEMRQAAR